MLAQEVIGALREADFKEDPQTSKAASGVCARYFGKSRGGHMLRNRIRLIGLAIMTGLLLSIMMAPSVLAHDDRIKSSFAMHDNTNVPFTLELGGFGTHHTFPIATPEQETHGSGKFALDGEDLDDLKFWVKIEARDLLPDTEYGISVSVRDLATSVTEGADGDVEVGKTTTDGSGNLSFWGKAVLPNPVTESPEGIASGWRIDQRITLLGPDLNLNECVDCVLVCSPTTKVMLNDDGDELVPFGSPADDDDSDDDDSDD